MALGSVVYVPLQPSIYKAEALLLPPKTKDVQSLNVQGVKGVTSVGVFAAFKNNLSSGSLQKKFIDEQGPDGYSGSRQNSGNEGYRNP